MFYSFEDIGWIVKSPKEWVKMVLIKMCGDNVIGGIVIDSCFIVGTSPLGWFEGFQCSSSCW